jgi:hypothetical protein
MARVGELLHCGVLGVHWEQTARVSWHSHGNRLHLNDGGGCMSTSSSQLGACGVQRILYTTCLIFCTVFGCVSHQHHSSSGSSGRCQICGMLLTSAAAAAASSACAAHRAECTDCSEFTVSIPWIVQCMVVGLCKGCGCSSVT